jgi:cystathionine beta-lyase/cystathionine gamma-synthase
MAEHDPDPIHADLRKPDDRYVHRHLATQAVHAGERFEKAAAWTSSTPIYNSTTYFYDTAQDLDDVVYYRRPGYIYSRYGTPTHTALERALSTLERAEVTQVCSSGMAASHLALLAAGAGRDELILCSSDVYGSVYTMVENIFPNLGGRSILMDFTALDRLEEVMRRERPRVVYFEVVTNPMTRVVDAPAVIEMAYRYGARVVVDNTFTTPYLLRPMELGADFVTHSVTKFLSGHGDVLAGSVSCRRQDFARLFDILIQVGCTLGPNEAWLALRGLKTFPLRFERQCANALEVARFFEGHPLVENVRYAGLPSHPQHAIAKRIFSVQPDPKGHPGPNQSGPSVRSPMYGAMLNFDVANCDKDKAFRFMDALRIVLAATSLGDIYSLMVNPARTTHHWLSAEQLAAMGIGPGTFRMSVGIEDVEDLKEDLDQALKACQ